MKHQKNHLKNLGVLQKASNFVVKKCVKSCFRRVCFGGMGEGL